MMPKNTSFSVKRTLNIRGKLLKIDKPLIMAIVNVTPDSFYSGSRYQQGDELKKRFEQAITDGASIIDIGAISTRPGAAQVSESEEQKRLEPALDIAKKYFPEAILSVDTYRSAVATWAVYEYNVGIINDISAGRFDPEMFQTIARLQVPYIIMHMQGTPENMQEKPIYTDVVKEVTGFLSERVHSLRQLGVNDIIVDPGFGFGKTIDHNYQLLHHFDVFSFLGLPVLAGLSRKSMIWKTLQITPESALNGTTALHAIALSKGASILRVHDVKEAKQTVELVSQCMDL
jgi:dihydropteroate synthase